MIQVSKHAIKRYKQRVTGKKTTSGQKCTEQIKKAVRSAYRIKELNSTAVRSNFGAYNYYTEKFIAVVQRSGRSLYIVTIKNHIDKNQQEKGVAI